MSKILIVDDEMDVRLMLEKRLITEGYSVITAHNGNTAISLARSNHPDLIVLDRILGDMLGEEVAERLREDSRTRDVPVIFLSALFSKEQQAQSGGLFNNSVMVAKPYDADELLAAVKKLLREKKKLLKK